VTSCAPLRRFSALLCLFALSAGATNAMAEKTLRIAISAEPPSKGNPYSTTGTTPSFFWTSIYDALTIIDNDGKVQPWLALSWQATSETTWQFKLRPDVVFSNGEPFNAQTVKTVIDFLKTDRGAGTSWARDVRRLYGEVRVIDELTVELETVKPTAVLPAYAAWFYMVPPKYLTEVGLDGLAKSPVGSGPFVVDDWRPGRVRLKRNTTSWLQPKVDTLEVVFVPDAAARMQALQTGRVDVAMTLGPDDIPRLTAAGHRVEMRTPTRTIGLTLLTTDEQSPFKDLRVRRAVNYAVDKRRLTSVLLGGLVEPASQPASKLAIGYDPTLAPYPYDPERARRLLADAGYPGGFAFLAESPTGGLPNDTVILQQIAADLAEVGIKMEVRLIPFAQLLKATIQGAWRGSALLMDFNNRHADALRPFTRTNHSCIGISPWYCNMGIQQVIDQASRSTDLDERTRLTRQIVRHYRDEASALWLFPVVGLDGVAKRVTRWEPWNDHLMFHLVNVAD
jgi:peptide/nickel transport system substrate-binding protein